MLDKRAIYYGKSVPNSFVTGAARHGDTHRNEMETYVLRYPKLSLSLEFAISYGAHFGISVIYD